MTPRSWIADLVQALHGATMDSPFMVYRSFIDEAGIQSSDAYLCLAGYIAKADEWERFEKEWNFVLEQYMSDLPQNERYFHALEFYHNHRKYRAWKRGKRESFENALFGVLRHSKANLYSCALQRKIFASMSEDERRLLTGGIHNGMKWIDFGAPTKPYFLPFQFCIIQAAQFLRETDKLFPVMSRQEQYKIHALELYEQMLNYHPALQCRSKLADDMIFSDPKKVAALQASDLAVYWMARLENWKAKMNTTQSDGFEGRWRIFRLLENVREHGDLKVFNFEGLMLSLGRCNRYIKTSFPTLDQQLPSLPLAKRKQVLGVMRRINLRRFLDHETLALRVGHD